MEQIIQGLRGRVLSNIPYGRVLEAIRQGVDVSRLEELRFSQWGERRNDPAINTLFMGAIIYGSDTLITEMLQHDVNVETLRTNKGENVLHMLIHRVSGHNPNSRKNLFGVVQSIVKSHPQLLKEREMKWVKLR